MHIYIYIYIVYHTFFPPSSVLSGPVCMHGVGLKIGILGFTGLEGFRIRGSKALGFRSRLSVPDMHVKL